MSCLSLLLTRSVHTLIPLRGTCYTVRCVASDKVPPVVCYCLHAMTTHIPQGCARVSFRSVLSVHHVYVLQRPFTRSRAQSPSAQGQEEITAHILRNRPGVPDLLDAVQHLLHLQHHLRHNHQPDSLQLHVFHRALQLDGESGHLRSVPALQGAVL